MKQNLDQLAAEAAQTIVANTQEYEVKDKDGKPDKKSIEAEQVDNLVTKALGVLQENGIYAAFLYLWSRSRALDEAIAKQVRKELLGLITTESKVAEIAPDPEKSLTFLTENVCSNLDKLLLVKQIWEQTLIYARYGAKARGVKEEADKKKSAGGGAGEQAQEETEKEKSQL